MNCSNIYKTYITMVSLGPEEERIYQPKHLIPCEVCASVEGYKFFVDEKYLVVFGRYKYFVEVSKPYACCVICKEIVYNILIEECDGCKMKGKMGFNFCPYCGVRQK